MFYDAYLNYKARLWALFIAVVAVSAKLVGSQWYIRKKKQVLFTNFFSVEQIYLRAFYSVIMFVTLLFCSR